MGNIRGGRRTSARRLSRSRPGSAPCFTRTAAATSKRTEIDELMARTDLPCSGCVSTPVTSDTAGGDPFAVLRRARVAHLACALQGLRPCRGRRRSREQALAISRRCERSCSASSVVAPSTLPASSPRFDVRAMTAGSSSSRTCFPAMEHPSESARRSREFLRGLGI